MCFNKKLHLKQLYIFSKNNGNTTPINIYIKLQYHCTFSMTGCDDKISIDKLT